MKYDIEGNPDVGDLTVTLDEGESIWAEAGAMSRMTGDMDMTTRLVGGFFKALIRKLVGGESLFVGEFTAPRSGSFVSLAPSIPGTVLHRRLDGDSLYLTAGSFLACTPGLQLKTRFGGLRAFFSGEGAFFVEATGTGDVFFNSYGAVVERTIDGEFVVDTGHLVAWEPSLSYRIGTLGGMKLLFFSGEGLVMRFSGQGKIYLQTRHLGSMAGWLTKYVR
jgi:uncharacterized protein (TIGR00266 family)